MSLIIHHRMAIHPLVALKTATTFIHHHHTFADLVPSYMLLYTQLLHSTFIAIRSLITHVFCITIITIPIVKKRYFCITPSSDRIYMPI